MSETEFPVVRFNAKTYIPRKVEGSAQTGIEYSQGWEGKVPRDVYAKAKALGVIEDVKKPMGPKKSPETESPIFDASGGTEEATPGAGAVREED